MNKSLPDDIIMIRNSIQDQEGLEDALGAWRTSKGVHNKLEAQSKSISCRFRTPGIGRTKTAAQVVYGVRFGRSLYGWKDIFNTLPMALVSGTNSSGVDRNRPNNLTSRICPGAATPSFSLWALYRVGAH